MWIIFRLQGILNYYFHFVDQIQIHFSAAHLLFQAQSLFRHFSTWLSISLCNQWQQQVEHMCYYHQTLQQVCSISANQHQHLKGSDFPNQLQQKLDWQLCEFSFCVCLYLLFFYISVCKSVFFKGMLWLLLKYFAIFICYIIL